MNLLQPKQLQVALFCTLLIIYPYKCRNDQNIYERIGWNQILLKLSTIKNKHYSGNYLKTSIHGSY